MNRPFAHYFRLQSLAVVGIFMVMGADPSYADALCGRNFSSLEQLRKDVADGMRVTICGDSADFVQIADHKERVLWTFLKPDHPAAPAAVCLIPAINKQGAPSFWMHARCGGPTPACDAFIKEFHTKRELMLKRLEGL